jgi:hypothetical protein
VVLILLPRDAIPTLVMQKTPAMSTLAAQDLSILGVTLILFQALKL